MVVSTCLMGVSIEVVGCKVGLDAYAYFVGRQKSMEDCG